MLCIELFSLNFVQQGGRMRIDAQRLRRRRLSHAAIQEAILLGGGAVDEQRSR